MLIDSLLAAPKIERLHAKVINDVKGLLRNAQKFDLAPDFAAAAEALSYDFRAVSHALNHCRLPYDLMWVEVAQNSRPRFSEADIHIPVFQSKPKRVGWLVRHIKSDDAKVFGLRYKAHLFWDIADRNDFFSACDIGMRFTLDEAHTAYDVKRLEDKSLQPRSWKSELHPGWIEASAECKSLLTTACVAETADWPCEYMWAKQHEPFIANTIFDCARADWSGEVMYLLAVLALLNSANTCEREHVTRTRLNKARGPSKLPLQDYYTLKIHTKLKRRFAGDGSHHFKDLRAHLVRGHFKTTKNGVSFWRPFLRGNPEKGIIHKDYQLTE